MRHIASFSVTIVDSNADGVHERIDVMYELRDEGNKNYRSQGRLPIAADPGFTLSGLLQHVYCTIGTNENIPPDEVS